MSLRRVHIIHNIRWCVDCNDYAEDCDCGDKSKHKQGQVEVWVRQDQ